MNMRRICAPPRLGEELLKKMGILEKTPEKKVESPREKGEPKNYRKGWEAQKKHHENEEDLRTPRWREELLKKMMF